MQSLRADEAHNLAAGDVVRTDDDATSIAEVAHRGGAVTRLDRASEAVIDRIDSAGPDRPRIVVTLGVGRTWHHTGPLDDTTIYEARCPAGVATARYAIFTVVCRPDGSADVAAVRGNVVVRGMTSGSVALNDGQRIRISGEGLLGPVAAVDPDDEWVVLNALLDEDGPDAPTPHVAQPDADADADAAPGPSPAVEARPVAHVARTFPRWATRIATVGAMVGFVLLLVATFVAAENGDHAAAVHAASGAPAQSAADIAIINPPVAPLPAGAAALIRAAQDRRVAPEPTTTTTTEKPPPTRFGPQPEAVPTTTIPAPVPAATAAGTSCAHVGSSLVYTGSITNTGPVASGFAVDAVFTSGSGAPIASASATVRSLAPHQRATWQVSVPAPRSTAGVSCDVGGVRPL